MEPLSRRILLSAARQKAVPERVRGDDRIGDAGRGILVLAWSAVGAEHDIEDWKIGGEIPIATIRIDRVVQPMPLRPGEYRSQRSERQSDIGMVEEAPAVEDGECDRCGDLVHARHDHGRNKDENKNKEELKHTAA